MLGINQKWVGGQPSSCAPYLSKSGRQMTKTWSYTSLFKVSAALLSAQLHISMEVPSGQITINTCCMDVE